MIETKKGKRDLQVTRGPVVPFSPLQETKALKSPYCTIYVGVNNGREDSERGEEQS